MLVFQRRYKDGTPNAAQLLGEGILVAMMGSFFAGWLFPNEAGIVAVFLASISSTDSIERLLSWNRALILSKTVSPATANGRIAKRLLALFIGATIGFSIFAMTLPLADVEQLYSHQLQELANPEFGKMAFGHPGDIAIHNIYVLLFFFIIALPFRQGGVMLAIAWNASVWGATFAVLARNWANTETLSSTEAFGRVLLACGPHLILEASAFICAGVAGVFLSKAFLRYALESEAFGSVLKSVSMLLLIGLVLVLTGAVLEGLFAAQLVGWLAG
jgi:uncharacterized membrane protein SpoIIM required for sporulation